MNPLPFLLFLALLQLRPASDIPGLIQTLKGSDWKARIDAARALGDLGPVAKDAVPALIDCLKAAGCAGNATFALGRIGPDARAAVPALIDLLKKDDTRDPIARIGAATALGQIGPDARDALPLLQKLASGKEFMVASAALRALGEIGDDGKKSQVANAVADLIVDMKDPAVRVRQAASQALGKIGPEARPAIPALIEGLKDDDSQVRSGSMFAIGNIGGNATLVMPVLINALSDVSEIARMAAAAAIGKYGPEASSAIPALVAALDDSNVWVRMNAAKSLGAIGPRARVEAALQKPLKDHSPDVRHAAAVALGIEVEPDVRPANPRPEEGVEPMVADFPTLLGFLNGGGTDARKAAAGLIKLCRNPMPGVVASIHSWVPGPWLKKCATTDFAPPIAALRDSDVLVREVAAEAMAALGPKAKGAVREILAAARDKDAAVRSNALEALGYIGADAAPAVPALVQMMQDGAGDNQLFATLGSIGRPATSALPGLLSAFRDKQADDRIRESALVAMVKIDVGAKDTQTALHEASFDTDGSLRAVAVANLQRSSDNDRLSAFTQALKDEDWSVRLEAIRALSKMKLEPSVVLPIYANALKDDNQEIRMDAAVGLESLKAEVKPALPQLIEALKQDDEQVKYWSAVALGNLGSNARPAVPGLIALLRQQQVAAPAARTLAKIKPAPAEAVPALVACLEDQGLQLLLERKACAEALGQMGVVAQPAIPVLIGRLKKGSVFERAYIVVTLGSIGIRTSEVEVALQAATQDDYPQVQQAATEALRKLRQQ